MARVDFYHLTRDPAPVVLARLAERVIGAGANLVIVAPDRAAQEAIDAALWSALPETFLAHMPAGTAPSDQAAEPIMLVDSLDQDAANGARITALSDGLWREEALAFDRTLYLFDGSLIEGARIAWRSLSKREGVECHYWKQDGSGRWTEGP